jgi:hypothetical protein
MKAAFSSSIIGFVGVSALEVNLRPSSPLLKR